MASTVTAIYNQLTKSVEMLVVDAVDLLDPAFNPPNCIQVPLDAVTYNELSPDEVYEWIYSVIQGVNG